MKAFYKYIFILLSLFATQTYQSVKRIFPKEQKKGDLFIHMKGSPFLNYAKDKNYSLPIP
ncbi:MAG: hypothetical protein K0R51_325 [Cytophagaceae bacterium]|jgi:hypothetical protein|nr:hypothetical protein [Cytophagaceae bacterium]